MKGNRNRNSKLVLKAKKNCCLFRDMAKFNKVPVTRVRDKLGDLATDTEVSDDERKASWCF